MPGAADSTTAPGETGTLIAARGVRPVRDAGAHTARHHDHGVALVAIDDPADPPLVRLMPRPAALLYVRASVEPDGAAL
ncbi:MAG: hypothetical protein LC798_05985 [Chloroflexi bacterium]|nr:hypothetical protein [Chloroflexota bacterium]